MKRGSCVFKTFCTALVGLSVSLTAKAEYPTNNIMGILSGTNNWFRTNTYMLNGMVFVRSNAVLNIEAGTVIKGHDIPPGDSTNVSALIICRGAKIYAEGTPHHPIIFTAEADETILPDDRAIWGPTARGLWGGVVILGRTTINSAANAAGNAANPKYEVYEGLPDVVDVGEALLRFGGTDDDDNSGILRYVSIRHGGKALFPNKEINGLSLGAVGRGTTVEFVEAYCIADDGFEFFGGTVNTKYLVSAFNDDDGFDIDQGYRGTNQFWFAIQAPDKRNYCMELNNQVNDIQQTTLLTPQADFKVYNMTIIGAGVSETNVNGGANAAVALRPWVGPKIYNAIFTDFNERGVLLDTQQGITATQAVTGAYAQFHNTLWWDFVTGSGNQIVSNTATNLGRDTVATSYWTDTSLTNEITNPMLINISRTNFGSFLDPRPKAGSPALSNYATVPNDGFLTPVKYRGAFGPNDLWIAHWTALWEYGIVTPPGQHTNIVSGILTGTNNWFRTNIYQLNGMVFVRSNAVLNIEPGTIIKGHDIPPGDSTNVSALIICRGAKIYAEGTPQNPIIFTAEADDITLPDDREIWGPTARGLWGGVVILGRTTINSAANAAGNAANPKYEVYEGLPDVVDGGEALLRFGGTDDDDNSGILRYVSIRHGGKALFPNKEINGLSLGAVGRGTTIEFVEAYCIADDGFEFFGGTVNTKYLVSAFNDDDGFDIDQGYRGTNQFWFAIQAPDKRNYGMELNNQVNDIQQTTLLTPQADFKVYNMTIIGAGVSETNVNGGANAAVALRPWVGPKIYNAIFTDFNERGVLLDTQQGITATQAVTGAYAQFHNTLWWDFVTGSGNQIVSNTATNLGRDTVATSYWTDTSLTNEITNPMLISISRTNFGSFLDPRPKAGSPALSNYATVPNDGFLTPVTSRGAFGSGRNNWASDWTALSEYGILTGAGANNPQARIVSSVTPPPAAPILSLFLNGASIEISFTTENGRSYQLQSAPASSGTYTNLNSAIPGTGIPATNTQPVNAEQQFFRVLAY